MESDEEEESVSEEEEEQQELVKEEEVVVPLINYQEVYEAEVVKVTELNTKIEEMDEKNKQLQIIINDLARRLQNAQYTIDAQRNVSNDAITRSAKAENDLQVISRKFQLEMAKSATIQRKKYRDEEAKKYEEEKRRSERCQEELRFALIDHSMTNRPREPVGIKKMRKKLEETEAKQDSLKSLLQQFSVLDQMTEDLSAAAQRGDLETCQRLLAAGCPPNEVDSAGFLPLHYACSAGYGPIVRLFLEFGADVTSYLTGYAPVEIAARSGHINVIQVLVDFGADIHETGRGGSPPLVSAAGAGHVDCLDYIVAELGANLRQCDLQGQSALHAAVRLPEPVPVIHYLLRAGIDTKMVNKKGVTAMQVALALSNIAALEALGGRHLETEGTGALLEADGSFAESFLDSSLGQQSSSTKINLSPLRQTGSSKMKTTSNP